MLSLSLLLMTCPTDANAQKWLRKLGNAIDKLGTGTSSTQTSRSTSSSSASTTKNVGVTPKIADCWRQGNYVWIAVTLTNNTASDKTEVARMQVSGRQRK